MCLKNAEMCTHGGYPAGTRTPINGFGDRYSAIELQGNRAGYKVRRHRFDVAAQSLALFYWSRFVSRVPVAPTKAGLPDLHCKPKPAAL